MKSKRDILMENYKNAEDFENVLVNKVRNELNPVSNETAACYAAAYAVYYVQLSFSPVEKDIIIDYATLFKLGGVTDKSRQKFLFDNLGDNINKLNDLFFVFPQQTIMDFLTARGMKW